MPVETRASTAKNLKESASRLDHNEIDALVPSGITSPSTLPVESSAPSVGFVPDLVTHDPEPAPSAPPFQMALPDAAPSATRPVNTPIFDQFHPLSLALVQSRAPEEIMRPKSETPSLPDPSELPQAILTTPPRTQPTVNFPAPTAVSTPQRVLSTNLVDPPAAPTPGTTAHPGMFLDPPQARRQLDFSTAQRMPNNSIPTVAPNPTLQILQNLESTIAEISVHVRSTDTNLTHLQDTVLREAHQVRLLMSDAATQFDITNSSIVGIVNALAKLREELSALGSKSDTKGQGSAHDTSFVPSFSTTCHPACGYQPWLGRFFCS